MAKRPSTSLIEHFSALDDPRQSWKVLYPLAEILLVVLCATVAGAEDFVEIRRWGTVNLKFLRRLLPFTDGIASHDTLNDVINAIDGELFSRCFGDWVESLRDAQPDIVAIDGKTSRRTHDRGKTRGPLHLVSAWASRQRLVLGQQACEANRQQAPIEGQGRQGEMDGQPSLDLLEEGGATRSPSASRLSQPLASASRRRFTTWGRESLWSRAKVVRAKGMSASGPSGAACRRNASKCPPVRVISRSTAGTSEGVEADGPTPHHLGKVAPHHRRSLEADVRTTGQRHRHCRRGHGPHPAAHQRLQRRGRLKHPYTPVRERRARRHPGLLQHIEVPADTGPSRDAPAEPRQVARRDRRRAGHLAAITAKRPRSPSNVDRSGSAP
jgi:hypothetical protein